MHAREGLDLPLAVAVTARTLVRQVSAKPLIITAMILAGVSQVVSGFAIWKPVQLSWLVALLGGFQGARIVHFAGLSVLVGFLVVHVALSLLVPRTLWAMLS